MEQQEVKKVTIETKKEIKKPKRAPTAQNIRVDKIFARKLNKIIEKANKKEFGVRIAAKDILAHILETCDDKIIDKAIIAAQTASMNHKDRKTAFIKQHVEKFGGSAEQLEEKMMELMEVYIKRGVASA